MARAGGHADSRSSGTPSGEGNNDRITFIIRAVGQHVHEDIDFKVRPTTLLVRIAERVSQRCGVPLEDIQLLHENPDIAFRDIFPSPSPNFSDMSASDAHLSNGDIVYCQLKPQVRRTNCENKHII
jgi:hypothetical protein